MTRSFSAAFPSSFAGEGDLIAGIAVIARHPTPESQNRAGRLCHMSDEEA